jgi:Na+/H+ antiporter NhaD/arsenite permease-like protein
MDPKPFMIIESILCNVGGTVFLISSVPNIMVSVAADISFLEFLFVSVPISFILLIVTIITFQRLFKIESGEGTRATVESLDEWSIVEDRNRFYRSVAIMIVVLIFFAIGDILGIGLPVVAITGSVFMLLVTGFGVEDALRNVGWSTIFFIMGLFVIVGTLNEVGVLSMFALLFTNGMGGNVLLSILSMLWLSSLFSALVVDIPATAVLIPIVQGIIALLGPGSFLLWWALIFGIAFGANYFPFSSSSTIIGMKILQKRKRIPIKEYTKIGSIVCTIQLAITSIYLMILYLLI